jgi:CO dehydrogenase maturation factor
MKKSAKRGMKIAISGKGGVGKSTIAAAWALHLAQQGKKVIAIDADPDANFAHALGMPEEMRNSLVTLADEATLIEERTGAKAGVSGQMFSLNPKVDDLISKYGVSYRGVHIIVLGAVRRGGGGCACPESTLLRNLVRHLVVDEDETVIIDMEAGIEHIGRGTADSVDVLVVVVEPGSRSVETAKRIYKLAVDIGLEKKIAVVLNKIRGDGEEQQQRVAAAIPNVPVIGVIPFDERLVEGDEGGVVTFIENVRSSPDAFCKVIDQISTLLTHSKQNVTELTK